MFLSLILSFVFLSEISSLTATKKEHYLVRLARVDSTEEGGGGMQIGAFSVQGNSRIRLFIFVSIKSYSHLRRNFLYSCW